MKKRCSEKFLSNLQENNCDRVSLLITLQVSSCNFIKKETLTQVFSCKFSEFFKNAHSLEHLWTAGSNHAEVSIGY